MPAYNEAQVIQQVITTWSAFLDTHFASDEALLLVVNDGSRDETGSILDACTSVFPRLRVIHQVNGGHGNAVLHAYRAALELQPEFIFQTDSDDQFECSDLLLLWEKRNQSPFILGNRQVRHDPAIRLWVTRILRTIVQLRFGCAIPDSNIPFRLMQADFLKSLLRLLPAREPFAPNVFLSVLACKNGADLMHIPVVHKARMTGEVSIRKWKLLKVLLRSWSELIVFQATGIK